MDYEYKEDLFLNGEIITRADELINQNQQNPFEASNNEDTPEDFEVENYREILQQSFKSYQSICNKDSVTTHADLSIIHKFVSSKNFKLSEQQQFLSPQFAESISKYLVSGQSDHLVEEAILILSNLFYHHKPNQKSPILDHSIVLYLFDIFEHVDVNFHYYAMIALLNYYLISSETQEFLIQNDILQKLRNYIIKVNCSNTMEVNNQLEIGIKFLYFLVKNSFSSHSDQFLQFLPIFPKLFQTHSILNRQKSLWILSIMIENEEVFNFCKNIQLHSSLSKCCFSPNNPYYYSQLYKCVFAFAKRGYLKAFSNEKIFDAMIFVLEQNYDFNISSVFFVISLLIDKYGSSLFDHFIHLHCMRYAKESCFENKLAACYCLSKFLIYSPPEYCDRLAMMGGLETICDLIECFNENDVILPLRAFKRLIELNAFCYADLLIKFQVNNFLINAYEEQMKLASGNSKNNQIHKEIASILFFLNNQINLAVKAQMQKDKLD